MWCILMGSDAEMIRFELRPTPPSCKLGYYARRISAICQWLIVALPLMLIWQRCQWRALYGEVREGWV